MRVVYLIIWIHVKVCIRPCVFIWWLVFDDSDEVWMIYIWLGDEVMMWILAISYDDNWELLYLFNWFNEMKFEYAYLYLNLEYYAWLFGRLHPPGVDVQVEDVWSTWVPEDGLMPTHPLYALMLESCVTPVYFIFW